jgi:hypothetical protein
MLGRFVSIAADRPTDRPKMLPCNRQAYTALVSRSVDETKMAPDELFNATSGALTCNTLLLSAAAAVALWMDGWVLGHSWCSVSNSNALQYPSPSESYAAVEAIQYGLPIPPSVRMLDSWSSGRLAGWLIGELESPRLDAERRLPNNTNRHS